MTRLVPRVRSRLPLPLQRRSLALLEGGHAAVHRGRSLDVDDLRGYAVGDDVRDIDWRATARTGTTLVRRYVADRQVSLVLVVPAGRELAAAAAGGGSKRDLAILGAGSVGWLAVHHGDQVRLLSRDGDARVRMSRPGSTEAHLEHLLQEVHARSRPEGPAGDLPGLLHHLAGSLRGRAVVLVVADDGVDPAAVESSLRSLRQRHAVRWLQVADHDLLAVPAGVAVREVGTRRVLPELGDDPVLRAAFAAAEEHRRWETETMLRRVGVVGARVGTEDEVVPAVLTLLRRSRHGR